MSKQIYLGESIAQFPNGKVSGETLQLLGEQFYCIRNYDQMPPFFMSLVSGSDHWMFVSSTGGLSAGRANAESALFPYYTDDKITENAGNTGPLAVLRVTKGGWTYLWEPFSERYAGLYAIERNLYKNSYGDKLIFEETNHDLGLSYRYAWRTSDRYGFVKTAWLVNTSAEARKVELLDGIQNILPTGANTNLQTNLSNLLNAYKRSELEPESGLGMFGLSSTLTDLAEPSEALRTTTVWQAGLERGSVLLSAGQVDCFRRGANIKPEADSRGARGAYLAHAIVELPAGAEKSWHIVAEVNQDSLSVAELIRELGQDAGSLIQAIEQDIAKGTEKLVGIVASADGLQTSADSLTAAHHFSNVLFNTMRGGIFVDNYNVGKADLLDFVSHRNKPILKEQAAFFAALPNTLESDDLLARAAQTGDADLERLCHEYLPLTFGRRHGDPSRPWNRFSINLKKADGSPRLDYQGNWRDIFQNWEPLAWSYPEFTEQMIAKFLNATTADGYNPYRITRDGIDWEAPSPDDPWANIGYWSDHQIIYLEKLMEVSARFQPGKLQALFQRRMFSHANVPYRIKEFAALEHDPYNTITFDQKLDDEIHKRAKKMGSDGKLLLDPAGKVFHVNMTEKLLILLLAKLGNFVPEGGIWMNTQRPEWNDANNALVGKGLSVVTLGYLLRYVNFWAGALASVDHDTIPVTREAQALFTAIAATLEQNQGLLAGAFTPEQRRTVMDSLGQASSDYRWGLYNNGISGEFAELSRQGLLDFLSLTRRYIEHSLRANRRPDNLYHAYNILHLKPGRAEVETLYEMLEGQVSILSSGLLSGEEALALLRALRHSKLYRADQHSYILYPDRDLPGFLRKNQVSAEQVAGLKLVEALDARNDRSLIARDINGVYHFNGSFRNAKDVQRALTVLKADAALAPLVESDSAALLELFEHIFHHSAFTGRSGTFFAYEGLGSIYWHMISKLLLAAQENYLSADESHRAGLFDAYYDIRQGLGFNKTPEVYGAFPTDPYSHTPAGQGAKQPGMTGQVKEEILTRFAEVGLFVENGRICFHPTLLRDLEFSNNSQPFTYIAVNGQKQTLELPAKTLAFTFCQVPVVCSKNGAQRIELTFADGSTRVIPGLALDETASRDIFKRTGKISRAQVWL